MTDTDTADLTRYVILAETIRTVLRDADAALQPILRTLRTREGVWAVRRFLDLADRPVYGEYIRPADVLAVHAAQLDRDGEWLDDTEGGTA